MKEVKEAKKAYLIEVIIITKSPIKRALSYFSTQKIKEGEIIKVPLKRGSNLGVVVSCRDLKNAKTQIRKAGFTLKKIRSEEITGSAISEKTLKAFHKVAQYYCSSLNSLLALMIPKVMLSDPKIFFNQNSKDSKLDNSHEKILLQMESEERFSQYRALVRQNFAKGKSVIFLAPTHIIAEKAQKELSRGIDEYVYLFSLTDTPRNIVKIWKSASENKHPVLFITTPAGLFFHRYDLATIIVERENSRAYESMAKPFINYKTLVEFLASEHGLNLIMGDSVLSLETLYKAKKGYYSENSLIRWRLQNSPAELYDYSSGEDGDGKFNIFSSELIEFIKNSIRQEGRIFLYGARKGLSPTTVCADCGFVLPCSNCSSPLVLHEKDGNRVYACHSCGAKRDSLTLCDRCGSWKLKPLGIGTQEIARRVGQFFPNEKIIILDKDHAPTHNKASSLIRKFNETGGILVGTELALFHLESIAYSAVISLDSLFSVPDFGVNERVFYLLSRIRELTTKKTLIQTKNIGKDILSYATQGNIIDFYSNEIKEREDFFYPPFTIFIKISTPSNITASELIKWKERFEYYMPLIYKNSIILRIKRDEWPDEKILEIISLLPPNFSIKVDPESIL